MTHSIVIEAWKKDYLRRKGINCLVCNAADTTTITDEANDAGYCTMDIECTVCGSTWQDVYTLIDVENIIEGDR